MNAARAAVVALIAFSGAALPTSVARADGDDGLLCGLLDPCDDATTDDPDDGAPPPDDDPVLDLDLEIDLDTAVGTEDDPDVLPTSVVGDLDTEVDIEVLPDDGTVLDVDAAVDSAAVRASALDHMVDATVDAALDTDASVGHDGVVVIAGGDVDAANDVTAGHRLLVLDAANHVCGVQVVIGAASSASCDSPDSPTSGSGDGSGLIAVAESLDVCGAHVILAGSAATDCGDGVGSPRLGSSWMLSGATVSGAVCGLTVAVAGESDTACSGAPQGAPGPGAGPNGPGTGTPGTGVPGGGSGSGGSGSGGAGGGGAAPAGDDSAQSPATEVDGAPGNAGSLPLTGGSIVMILALAAVALAAGLAAMRSSRLQLRHLS